MKLFPTLWALALAFLPAGDRAGSPPQALTIEVLGRARTPGEVLMIRATSENPLHELQGEFLGRKVFMSAQDPDQGARRIWAGWTMIELDREPGDRELRLQGVTADGATVVALARIRVEPREFPTEELSVSPQFVDPPPATQRRRQREREQLAEIYKRRTEARMPSRPFVRPVDGAPTSIFGTRRLFNGEPRAAHPGLDLRAATGTPVRASADAEVALAQDLYFAGNTVILDHGGGLFTLYAHLSEMHVKPGQTITAGQPIGLSGATGRVTGPHLHWGAKIGDLPFDPSGLLDLGIFEDRAGPAATLSKASAP